MVEEGASVAEEWAHRGEDESGDGGIVRVRRLIAGCAVFKPLLDVLDVAPLDRGAQDVVVGHLIDGLAVSRLERAFDELERELVGVLETLDDAVTNDLARRLIFRRSQAGLKLGQSVAEWGEVKGGHGVKFRPRYAVRRFIEHGEAYIGLLLKYVENEEDWLFPHANRLLNEDTERKLVEQFQKTESGTSYRGDGIAAGNDNRQSLLR